MGRQLAPPGFCSRRFAACVSHVAAGQPRLAEQGRALPDGCYVEGEDVPYVQQR